jgi:hypothetical protein
MNEPSDRELAELEAELRGLRPAALPPGYVPRIAAAMAADEPPPGRWRRLVGFGATAVATVAVVGGAVWYAANRRAQGSVFKPVSVQTVVTSARDEGEVILGDGTHAHRLAESVVDTVTWQNPRTHATLTWSVPREEVQIVPVTYH